MDGQLMVLFHNGIQRRLTNVHGRLLHEILA